MRELPHRALTDQDLIQAVKRMRIPNFRGVFMRDEMLKMTPRENECGIINLDWSQGPGTHWCSYLKRGDTILYYDSFGDLPPPSELKWYFRYCLSAGSSLEYNFEQEQKPNSVNCGHLCLSFLLRACNYLKEKSRKSIKLK